VEQQYQAHQHINTSTMNRPISTKDFLPASPSILSSSSSPMRENESTEDEDNQENEKKGGCKTPQTKKSKRKCSNLNAEEWDTDIQSEKSQPIWTCLDCGKRFTRKWNLTKHRRRHLEPMEKRFGCSLCGKSYGGKSDLRVHIRSHTGEKPFGCNLCNKQFKTNRELTIHQRSHTGEKPFRCLQCSKAFTTKGHLTRHTRVHSGETPFTCSLCGNSFNDKTNMNRHLRRVHSNNEKPRKRRQKIRVHDSWNRDIVEPILKNPLQNGHCFLCGVLDEHECLQIKEITPHKEFLQFISPENDFLAL